MNMYVQNSLLAFLAKTRRLDCDRHMQCVDSYGALVSSGRLNSGHFVLHAPGVKEDF